MREENGKREIEAVCDVWEGGLVGYLEWKIREFLEDTGINFMDLDDDIMEDLNSEMTDSEMTDSEMTDTTEMMDTETTDIDGIYDI